MECAAFRLLKLLDQYLLSLFVLRVFPEYLGVGAAN
jgi:hypothetical protein